MSKVQSILKKTLKAVLWMVAGLVFLLIIIVVLIQIPVIQNKVVHYAASFISRKTHSIVEVKNITISFPKTLVVKGLFMEDLKKDTLLYVGEAKVNISFKELLSRKIDIKNFSVENATLNANRIRSDSLFNYNFLLTAFSDTTKQTKPDTTSKWTFSLDNVSLKNIRLHYDDEHGGINAKMTLGELALKMEKIDLTNSMYAVDEMLIESVNANVLMTKPVIAANTQSVSIMPRITAKKIVINNSKAIYGDSISRQSVMADINRFELNGGTTDLQKGIVSFDKLLLSKSELDYHTVETASSDAATSGSQANNWNVTIKSFGLDDNTLDYDVENKPVIKNAFDSNHLKYSHLTLDAADIVYSSKMTAVSVKKFSAIDQNNFSITKFETDFSMDQHALSLKKLKVETRFIASLQTTSSIAADLSLQYPSLKSLRDSISIADVNLNIENASIQNSDVLYFNPQLISQPFFKNKKNITTFSGIVNGRVNNLKGKDVVIKTGIETVLKTDFTIEGLPEMKTAYFDFPNLQINSGKRDIEMMGNTLIPKNIDIPDQIKAQIAFKGKMKSFESTVKINSSFGAAQLFAAIDRNQNFKGKINITDFDLGRLMKDNEMYGPVTLTAEAQGRGLDPEGFGNLQGLKAKINAEVSQIYLNKYTYHNLKVDGNVNGQEFEGKINLNDENAVVDFDGLVNLNPNEEQYKFQLKVEGADLQKLNFTKNDLRIGLTASADLKGGTVNKMNGKVQISNMIFAKGEKKYVLDSLFFASINQPDKNEINFRSALIGVKYTGTISPFDLSAELNNFINNYFPVSEDREQSAQTPKVSKTFGVLKKGKPSKFNFEIQLHNHPILTQVLLTELKEFEPGIIKGSFDSEKSDLKLDAEMKRIVYGTTVINDLVMNVNSNSSTVNYKISGRSISNAQIKLDNFLLEGKLAEKTLFANVSSIAGNRDKKIVIHSQITKDKDNYKLALDPKDLFLMNNRWDIAADNYIEFGKEGFLIHHFFINNAESHINIASVHDKFNDDLNIEIKNFKLDDISRIVEKDTSLVKGNVDGNVLLKRVNNAYGIIADAKITSLFVRDIPIGDIAVKADNPSSGKFDITMNLSGNENNVNASGYFIPNGSNNSINIKTAIQSLSMKTIEAFSMGQITGASGTLSGNLDVQGAANAPEITGELVFNNAFFNPMVLNSRIELKHETIQFAREGINFKSFTLLDADQHTAIIDGTVQMKQFKDFIFALNINTKDFLLFNSTSRENKTFFGRMLIDSKIDIKGPMTLPVINGRLKMKKGSNFTFAVPEEKLTTDKGENTVEFENPIQLNPILNRTENKEEKSGFTGYDLSSIIEVDKEATLKLLMDPGSTDSLVVKGEAALSFIMDKSGKMSLTGIYNLNEGSYLVSFQSVIKRKFDINPPEGIGGQGSHITWNGDPLDADVSIDATYTARAVPYDLVADQMSGMSDVEKGGYKLKYPFLVLLKLRGPILHPAISFEIQLSPKDKGILGGAVNQKLLMLNEDAAALNKQVFALLILGRFVQENPFQTESGGTSGLVRSTVGAFLSSQLNKLSSKALPGTELNFDVQSYNDYETGQAKGRTQVGIGIKQQLFNERISVQVGGNVDVEGEKASQNSASNITGDVTVEYKMTKDGRFRLKGFRQNRYEGAIEGQLVETGAGFSYVKDFNKWKYIFKSKKKRAAENEKMKK